MYLHAYLEPSTSEEAQYPSISERPYCDAPAAITESNLMRAQTSEDSMQSEVSVQDKLIGIPRVSERNAPTKRIDGIYKDDESHSSDYEDLQYPGLDGLRDVNKYANDTRKAKLYMKMGKFEQRQIMGEGDIRMARRKDVNLWLFFTSLVFLYACLGALNVLDVVVDQGMWRLIDVFSMFNIIVFGYGLALMNFLTYILAGLDGRENGERAPIQLESGMVIPAFGRMDYDEKRQQFYEVHLLNPALVRFILYLDFFWIINGCICSLAAVIFWACFYSQERCRIITYIYTFAPLPVFILLLCKRKSIFMRMALAAYWPSDLTRESGRFNGKIGEIAEEHFRTRDIPEEIEDRMHAQTEQIYSGLTTRQVQKMEKATQDKFGFGVMSPMMSADDLEEPESEQDYRVTSSSLRELEQGKH